MNFTVFLTSPTYDGIVSDVKAIADIVHRYRIPLIVDEAHGAHFGMHPAFPESSVALGADIVIHSGTKYLGGHSDTTAFTRPCRPLRRQHCCM